MQPQASLALEIIDSRQDRFCVVLQNLIEFWSVATRPVEANGLGFSQSEAEDEIQNIESVFTLLPESPDIAKVWRRLIHAHPTSSKNVHDARLVASMLVHKVTHLLTFNSSDFVRYSEIKVFEPRQLIDAANI